MYTLREALSDFKDDEDSALFMITWDGNQQVHMNSLQQELG
jgi:hypothetical protein